MFNTLITDGGVGADLLTAPWQAMQWQHEASNAGPDQC
jgi:hypothetical protein